MPNEDPANPTPRTEREQARERLEAQRDYLEDVIDRAETGPDSLGVTAKCAAMGAYAGTINALTKVKSLDPHLPAAVTITNDRLATICELLERLRKELG